MEGVVTSPSTSSANNGSGGGASGPATAATVTFDHPTASAVGESPLGLESPDGQGDHHHHPRNAGGTPTGGAALNPRSCIICRRRKVRCNKTFPCSNCAKAKVQCVFPAPERAKRRPRKPPDGELMSRLRRLEGVIQGMGMSVEEELAASGGGVRLPSEQAQAQAQMPLPQSTLDMSLGGAGGMGVGVGVGAGLPNKTPLWQIKKKANGYDRLIVNEGKSRYMNNQFWATFTSELEDLKGILDESSDEEEDEAYASPATDLSSPPVDSAYFFSYSSLSYDLPSLHPPAEHIWMLWETYKEYNDPVVKMVHIPTMESQVQAALHNPGKSSKPFEAFLFAVYFAAVTALTPEAVFAQYGETRDALVKRFRFGLEQALARANFLISEELLVIVCYLTYLACLRCHEDGRLLWSRNGVAVRMAISMGLHRDGTNFGISPYETELRRRVWWQLVALEWRGSQDSGIEPFIMNFSYDTHLPLNINDADMAPSMAEAPQARKGLTDMTFCVLRYDLQKSLHKLFAPHATLQDKEKVITETHQHLENDYFRYCDMSQGLDWTICTVAKLIMARQFLILYHPHIKTLPQHTIDRLFVTALDSIEFALRLETERKMVKWGWLFKTYNQWHALAFLLSELTRRTKGPLVQRAWRAVNSTVAEVQQSYNDTRRGQLWKPVMKLLQTARAAREREIKLEAQNMQLDHSKLATKPMSLARDPPPQPSQAPAAMHGGMRANGQAFGSLDGLSMGGGGGVMDMGGAAGMTHGMANLMMGNNNNNGAATAASNDVPMPSIEADLSTQSNPIDSQYTFDNTSNTVPMTSEFFGSLGLWHDGKLEAPGAGAGADWFGNWAVEHNVATAGPYDQGALAGAFAPSGEQGWQESVASAHNTPGGTADAQWMGTDWDEVMKEFAIDGAPAPNGASQWSKPPNMLMNETWL